MKSCAQECYMKEVFCIQKSCRKWIDYSKDMNCAEIAIKKNGSMTLKEVGKRLNISYVRVAQIEKVAIQKMKKQAFTKNKTNYNNK